MLDAWMGDGLVFMDEPESALSPQRQLMLLSRMAAAVRTGRTHYQITRGILECPERYWRHLDSD